MNIVKTIEDYVIPQEVVVRFVKEVDTRYGVVLSQDIIDATIDALKDYFIFGTVSNESVGMPSILVDELWHAFLLFTREYHQFCDAIGSYFHHAPEVDNKDYSEDELIHKPGFQSLLRCYAMACEREGLDAFITDEAPLLFTMDAFLPEEHGTLFDIKWLQEKLKEIPLDELM